MTKTFLIAVVLTVSMALAPVVYAAATKATNDFVQQVSSSSRFEIDTSKLALEKSKNDDVRRFAQKMIDEHTKTENKLKSILPSSTADASAARDMMDSSQQATYDKLKAAPPESFDQQYIDAQKEAHKDAATLLRNYSQSGDDKTLKDFAAQTAPDVEQHLQAVQQLKS